MKKKFITLFVSAFAVMLGMGIVVPLMPLYAQSMGATGIWLGIVFSAYSLASLILTPLMGNISDKRGRKKFICIGLLLYTVLSLGYVFADSVYSLTWVRFLHGFASAMVLPLVMAYVGDIVPMGKEGKYMGYFNVSMFMGVGFGPFIGGVLTDSFGMVSVFYAMCAPSAFALIVTSVFLTEETQSMIKKAKMHDKVYGSFKSILSNDIVKGLLTYRFINAIGMPAATAITTTVGRKYGVGTATGLFTMAMSAGMVISPLAAGGIMDTIGVKFIFYLSGAAAVIGTILFYLLTKNYGTEELK